MASGIYGRRVVEPHISDHTLFLEDQYPAKGASRALSNDLETVWDKVNDAKAVLQKLEHRIEVTEDAKKAEDLAFSTIEPSSHKKRADKTSRPPSSAMRGTSGTKASSSGAVSTPHKVAFQEPLVSYHEEFDPLHGTMNAGKLASTVSTIQGENASFIARDLRTNDFDLSRVSVRNSFRPNDKLNGQHSTPVTFHSSTSRPPVDTSVPSKLPASPGQKAEPDPQPKGAVVPLRVLNDPADKGLGNKSRPKHKKQGRDLKSAGVATTVITDFNPDQVYKYLQKEGIRKAAASKSAFPSNNPGARSPLFLSTPNAPYKRFDIVKQRKNMEKNSQALARLKEKIERQKQRSPSSIDSSPGFTRSHREDDPVVPMTTVFNEDKDKPRMRKIAHGPAAPKYKGFSTAETRIRTPDGKVWKEGETNHPYIPPRAPDKKSKAVTSLFKPSDGGRSKPHLTSGRLKGVSFQNESKDKSKNQKPMRKTGKIRPEDPTHKKTIITPSSWREGQRVAESILGPPPKQPRKVSDKQRPNSPPTRDTNSAAAPKKPPSRPPLKTAASKSKEKKLSSSIKASIPTDKLSVEARGVLDDLHLTSSDSESDQDDDQSHHERTGPDHQKKPRPRGRAKSPRKHQLPRDSKDPSFEKMQKVRHYDQNKVQQYIARQKAERKRKQSEERRAQKEAQDRKQKQLEELYRKQKEACAKKKPLEVDGKFRNLRVDQATAQALQKIEDILDETNNREMDNADSDKENSQRRQPMARFDERMSAFMDKLNQYQPVSTSSKPADQPPITSKPTSHYLKETDTRTTSAPPLSSDVASEFMQKLDRYLKDDSPVTAVSGVPALTPPSLNVGEEEPASREPNLTVEDLGAVDGTSPKRPETAPAHWDKYGDPSGTYSPRYRQMISGMDVTSPRDDLTTKQKSRTERIAALKAKAESLQDRIQAESRRLIDQPIVPIRPRLDEIDEILAKSGHGGRTLPIHAWSQETAGTDYRDTSPQWQTGHRGMDVPDNTRSRGGLDDFSPSQLPGVAGLRQHVTEVEENKKETDAALKIQSAFRGHAVRQAMDTWELPSGQSMTDVRRQAASLPSVRDKINRNIEPETQSISEGPLSSRSDDPASDRPIRLRSVEEILEEMKQKEYCVADPSPLEEIQSPKWEEQTPNEGQSPRENIFSELGGRLHSGRSSAREEPLSENEKPPWERTGGDKYSIVNVFTNKYLKALKKQEREERKQEKEDLREKTPKRRPEVESLDRNVDYEKAPSNDEYSERFEETASKKSPRTRTSEKYSPRFDDTGHDLSESLSSSSQDAPGIDHVSPPRSDYFSEHLKKVDDLSAKTLETKSPVRTTAGKVSYTSSEEESSRNVSNLSSPDEKIPFEDDHVEEVGHVRREGATHSPPVASRPPPRVDRVETLSAPETHEKKYSPAALEQRMKAELNYQDAIEESLRHLTGVERTQGVSLAQQETVSLAQLMKARQLQHEVEMERLTMKAKEEALEAEKRKNDLREEEERVRREENAKIQEATRKSLETQAEAARTTAEAAKRLTYALNRDTDRREYAASYSSMTSDPSRSPSITTTGSARRQDISGASSNSSEAFDASLPKKGDKISSSPEKKDVQRSPPSLMSEHSTTSVRHSDNDTQSSIPEQVPSTEDEAQGKKYEKPSLDRSDISDTSSTKSIAEELDVKRPFTLDDTDKSISEDLTAASDDSVVKPKIMSQKKKLGPQAKETKPKKAQEDSDSSELSVRFDESLTEDEIAEISRRVVVPSESHRRHQRRRSPHTGALDRSDISSDDQPASGRQKTPRADASMLSLDDFAIGPALSGAADSEFSQFMDGMVRQYMLEDEVRAKHQAAMLKLRERAIKEKTEKELKWLEKMKRQVRNKGEDDKMPPIKKKQRAILLRLKLEQDEIKRLRAVTKAVSQERKLFLQQHQENATRRAKLRAAEEKLDVETGLLKGRSRPQEDNKEPHLTSSTPIPNTNLPEPPDVDEVSESNSELDLSSASSILMKKLMKQIPSSLDERRLTKREQRLLQRKKQAEQLIAWRKRLDQEEKQVYDIEKQALSAWDKESEAKRDRSRHPPQEPIRKPTKDPEDSERKSTPKADTSREESSSGKSPESEHHSSPPPPSHSESSIAEEIIQINSGTNSSQSAVSPVQDGSVPRNQEESSDGTNADDYSQSFESVNTSQRTPRSPRGQDKGQKTEKVPRTEPSTEEKKEMKPGKSRPDGTDSPSATPLLPHSKAEKPAKLPPTKTAPIEKEPLRRRESVESWSDESFSQTQSETEQSDIECRVRALKEELKRRRMIAEKLKKEQKRRHKDRLKAQEASLRSQIEAYDVFIRKTQNELTQELDHQLNAASSTANSHLPVAKPQIRSPRKSDQARQSARALRSAAVVSPEASPRSGSHRAPAAVSILGKNRTESESSGKSSRSLSFDDDEKTPDDATPNGSTKSFSMGVVSQASPLPSKHQDKLPPHPTTQHHDTATTPLGEKKVPERPKRLDLTDAAVTLSKLIKPPSTNGCTVPSGASALTTTSSDKSRSLIPVASKTPPSSGSQTTPPKISPTSTQQQKRSLIPLPVSTSGTTSTTTSKSKQEKPITSPPSPLASEKSLTYSEDFESSANSKKDASIATDDDISEHFSDASTATSGDKSDRSGALLDLSAPSKQKSQDANEINKDDTLHGVEELALLDEKKIELDEEDEETPVASPARTPVASSPRTPTPDHRDLGPEFSIGDKVLLAGRETGIVRFIGETQFAPGSWVGAELHNPMGKNDGSVNNVRYFTCSPKHGIFAPVTRVSLLSPKSQSSTSTRSSGSIHFEYMEDSKKVAQTDEEEEKSTTESELSKAINDASKNFENFAMEMDDDQSTPQDKPAEMPSSPVKTSPDRNRLADELSDKLLTSLLEDSVTNILESHANKRQRTGEGDRDTKRRKKKAEEGTDSSESTEDEEAPLSTSTQHLLEMLASSPTRMEGDMVEEEDEEEMKTKAHESLADTFTGDLLTDTLTKVLEIRRQRAKKWAAMSDEEDDDSGEQDTKPFDLDNGREVEDILLQEAKSNKKRQRTEPPATDGDRDTPVRPVSPVFGSSQDDILEEWIDDDFGLSSFDKKKPLVKNDEDRLKEEEDIWQDGRLIEVLSSRIEPPTPPPKFVVPHKPEHILRLIEDAVDYYYSKHLRGELGSDVRIPDFLYNDQPGERSEDEKDAEEVEEEKKEADRNADHVFKTSLFDMVRELISEIYSTKTSSEEMSKRPLWMKKKVLNKPSYCRRVPRSLEELQEVVAEQVNKSLNLRGDALKLDPKITMKWGSRKKKDKVDIILIQELREEEPEWTNYDEDETTVKMQLTDTVLEMLLSDTVKCLDEIGRKKEARNPAVVPAGVGFEEDPPSSEERSQ